ncbi:MAG TPA: hypothetical protein VIL88_09925 [Devosia sp.]|jgi:hypothetical protein|uniref:hypothetical protein n=1 Tax=Devosia sp. TaxID=1871048 RepID=UPI002F953993
MTKHLPPIPPQNRSTKGPGDTASLDPNAANTGAVHGGERNLAQQGRQGNSKQNTTHQGYQQDR